MSSKYLLRFDALGMFFGSKYLLNRSLEAWVINVSCHKLNPTFLQKIVGKKGAPKNNAWMSWYSGCVIYKYIIYNKQLYIPRTQMTLVLIEKGLVLKG